MTDHRATHQSALVPTATQTTDCNSEIKWVILDESNENNYRYYVTTKTSSAKSVLGPPDRLAPLAPRRISSEMLLGPSGELVIVHGGREYRLRITQNGKLILTA